MAENLPDPLTPADCDLRSYGWMPNYGNNLRTSDFDALANDAEWRAAHNLWWAAWLEVPAASLPDNDVILCKHAGLGRDQKAWAKVKKVALHGFVKCSDGRLYHKFLSTLAVKGYERRLRADKKRSEDRGRLKTWRDSRKSETQNEASSKDGRNTTETQDETSSETDLKQGVKRASSDVEKRREEKREESKQQLPLSNPREAVPRIGESPERWMHLGEKTGIDDHGTRHPMVNGYFLDVVAEALCQAAKINTATWRGDWRPLIAWLKADIPSDLIIETVRQIAARPGYKPPASLAYFDKPIRERAGLECAA